MKILGINEFWFFWGLNVTIGICLGIFGIWANRKWSKFKNAAFRFLAGLGVGVASISFLVTGVLGSCSVLVHTGNFLPEITQAEVNRPFWEMSFVGVYMLWSGLLVFLLGIIIFWYLPIRIKVRKRICKACKGTGKLAANSEIQCSICKGKRFLEKI